MRIGKVSQESSSILSTLSRSIDIPGAKKPTSLFPLRSEVDTVNKRELNSLDGEEVHYKAMDWTEEPRLQKKLDDSIMAPKNITLRIGAQVMLIKNLRTLGLFNGSIGTVKHLEADAITVEFDLAKELKTAILSREVFELEKPSRGIYASRSQFPLILAYAMSIHKSQGQTLKYVTVDLKKIFEKGQAYVALSRCTSLDGLVVYNFDARKVQAHPKANHC